MKKILLLQLAFTISILSFAQDKYAGNGGIETAQKDKYKFTAKLDEKTNVLSFETDAPVTVATLEIYTPEELAVRKGKEYTNTYTKVGNKYLYDLKKLQLKDKYAYWIKVSIGNNGVPLGEYFFRRKTTATAATAKPAEETEVTNENGEEKKNAAGATIITTNIKCAAGKTNVINALKKLDGVNDVKIDIATGKLTIGYSSDGTAYTSILSAINKQGFDAGAQKSTNAKTNPCK
jgi:copper chaperone CopZ